MPSKNRRRFRFLIKCTTTSIVPIGSKPSLRGTHPTSAPNAKKTPVLNASTIEVKVLMFPDLEPVCTWCAQWLHAAPRCERRWSKLRSAHDTAREQAMAKAESTQSLLSPEFTQTLDALRTNSGFKFPMLLNFAGCIAAPPTVRSARNQGLQGIVRSIC